jgi:hypothetical protein
MGGMRSAAAGPAGMGLRVGPGLLAALTFWPAVICVVIGIMRVRQARNSAAR